MTDTDYIRLSPFTDHLGMKIVDWKDGEITMTAQMKPEFGNSGGLPHGGFLCSLLDTACSIAGLHCPNNGRIRRALTLSLNTNFMGQPQDNKLTIKGRVVKSGYKIYHSEAQVYDGTGELLATATAVLKYTKGSEKIETTPQDTTS